MKKHRWGLRLKVSLGLLLPLIVVIVGSSYMRYVNYRQILRENLELSTANITEAVKGSLLCALFTQDLAKARQVLDAVVRRPGVLGFYLLDDQGRMLISATGTPLGEDQLPALLSPPDTNSRPNGSSSPIILTDPQGSRIMRRISPVGADAAYFLISDYTMAPFDEQLAAYRRSRLLFSIGSILLILFMAVLIMNRLVVDRLRQFVGIVQRVGAGDLDAQVRIENDDEIAELAEAFNLMTKELKSKEKLERQVVERTEALQREAEKLAALNTVAFSVSQSLNLREVLYNALDKSLALTKLRAGWIVLRDHRENNNPLASRGLPQEAALAHVECAWSRPVCSEVLALVESKVVPNTLEYPCPVSEFLRQEGLSFRVCVPLQSKERVLGVMTLFGDIPGGAQEFAEDALEMLTSIGRQIGVAIENARLYDELRQQEGLHRQLLDRLITVQEEERRRIARELHDQTGQSLTSLIMVLKLLEEADSSVPIRPYIEEARDMAVQILRGVRDLALQLRPSALDDLGLLAAFRHYFRRYETRFRLPVDFQVLGVSQERLPPDVETALYRIMQEALTNVARHAQATNVSVLLEMRKGRVKLIIEDDGQGFDVARVMGSRAHERNLGLYGMRERATLVGGMFTIESTPGVGTTVFVEIPLGEGGPS